MSKAYKMASSLRILSAVLSLFCLCLLEAHAQLCLCCYLIQCKKDDMICVLRSLFCGIGSEHKAWKGPQKGRVRASKVMRQQQGFVMTDF